MPPTRPACALAAIASSVALAACGSSTSTKNTSVTGAPVELPSPSGTSSSTTGTTSAAAQPACTATVLAARFLGQQGAAGHGEVGFELRNTSARSCHTYGYPGIQFLSAGGSPLPTASTRITHDLFGTAPASKLVVAPGASVSFRLGVTHGIASSAGCTTAAALQVIAPDDTVALKASIPGGAYECGTATLTPLQPGQSAYR
jgi:hypothetical protein